MLARLVRVAPNLGRPLVAGNLRMMCSAPSKSIEKNFKITKDKVWPLAPQGYPSCHATGCAERPMLEGSIEFFEWWINLAVCARGNLWTDAPIGPHLALSLLPTSRWCGGVWWA